MAKEPVAAVVTPPADPAATPAPAADPAIPAVDDFTAAFASFSKPEEDPTANADTTKKVEATPAVTPATPAADGDTPAADGTTPAADDDKKEIPDKKEDDDDALLARFAEIVKKTAAPEPTKTEAAPVAPAAPALPDLYTAEEKTFLETYRKDWPDVAKAEELRSRALAREIVQYVFTQVGSAINPLTETVRELTASRQLADLEASNKDYGDIRDKVVDWAGKQPAYLQDAYNRVITEGTIDEVNDLIARYRKDTGTVAAAPAAAAPAKKADIELPAATKKAVESLAPVNSKRSAVVQTVDPNDFGAAFKAFASELN